MEYRVRSQRIRAAAAPGGGGGCFHLSFRSGSRGGGASARSGVRLRHAQRPVRRARIAIRRSTPSRITCRRGPTTTRARTGMRRTCTSARMGGSTSVPISPYHATSIVEDQIDLAREFAQELTDEEQLPYTLAIHAGRDEDGREHNPHAHLMFSERRNDGIERSRDEWFRRANSAHPERGGAPKSRTFHGRDWVEQARERWADGRTQTLERPGDRNASITAATSARASTGNQATTMARRAPHVLGRGGTHERLDEAPRGRRSREGHPGDRQADRATSRPRVSRSCGTGCPRNARDQRDYSHSSGPRTAATTSPGGGSAWRAPWRNSVRSAKQWRTCTRG